MIEITAWRQEDLVAIRSFIEQLQEHERSLFAELRPGAEISADYLQKLLGKISDKNGLLIVARDVESARAVGFICAWLDHDDDQMLRPEARDHAYISDIFVSGEYRGRGIASQLLQKTEQAMRERGASQIRLCSKATNHLALRCYDNNGYSAYETILTKRL